MIPAPRTSLIVLALLAGSAGLARAQVTHPNVIVILTDDQGTADLHIAGASDIDTPNLDALARAGCGSRSSTPRRRCARRRAPGCSRAAIRSARGCR